MTFAQLKTDVASLMNRSDSATLDLIPSWVKLVNAKVNRKLETADMEVYGRLATVSGQSILPEDYITLANVQVEGLEDPLTYVEPNGLDGLSALSGTPQYYTIQGRQMLFYPAPDDGTVIEIRYSRTVPELSADDDTNWLLSAHPDIYLYGVTYHGFLHIQQTDFAATSGVEFMRAMDELSDLSARELFNQTPQTQPRATVV